MNETKLYHGTDCYFEIVDLLHCKERKDFGFGFYLTSDYSQAKDWAIVIAKMNNSTPYTNLYRVDSDAINELNVHRFSKASRAWIKYIIQNRYVIKRHEETADYDLVIGKVADARANIIIADYINRYGLDTCLNSAAVQNALIKALKPERLHDQYCFKTEMGISLLNRVDEYNKPLVSIKRINV